MPACAHLAAPRAHYVRRRCAEEELLSAPRLAAALLEWQYGAEVSRAAAYLDRAAISS